MPGLGQGHNQKKDIHTLEEASKSIGYRLLPKRKGILATACLDLTMM